MSASLLVRVLLSLAWKTMFFTALHLCRRSCQSALVVVGTAVGNAPLSEGEIRSRFIEFCPGLIALALHRTCGILVFHDELGVARTSRSGSAVNGDEHRQRSHNSLHTTVDMSADGCFSVLNVHHFFSVSHLVKAELLGYLRTHLGCIAVDGLPSAYHKVDVTGHLCDLLYTASKGNMMWRGCRHRHSCGR